MPPSPLIEGLASAFLAGDWSVDGLAARGRLLLGRRHAFVRLLARKVVQRYPEPPLDHPDRLAQFLSAAPEMQTAIHASRPPRLRRWIAYEPVMGDRRWPVPEIATVGELAAWLGVTSLELDWLATARNVARDRPATWSSHHYRYRWVEKRSEGARLLEAPKDKLATVQRNLLRGVLDLVPAPDAAHGFRRGRSVMTFATPHVNRDIVVLCDLEGFFASVRWPRVRAVLRALGYPDGVARVMASLATNETPRYALNRAPKTLRPEERRAYAAGHLPQGSPTSPALANLCAYRMDTRLSALANRFGWRYTRYADDLAFSGDGNRAHAEHLVPRIGGIALEEGFSLNFRKTRVMSRAGRQWLAGVVVNTHPSVARDERDRLEAILVNCVHHGAASQNREGLADFRTHIEGRVAWVASVNPAHGARLRALLRTIRW